MASLYYESGRQYIDGEQFWMRILIAEDDGPLAAFVAKAFKSEDHVTEIAASGDDALQRIQ
jgi:CheY-like chemotaxis protein